MSRAVAVGQNRGVDCRVERLHPPIENLGSPRDIRHQLDRYFSIGQDCGRSAGRNDLDPAVHQDTGQVDQPLLVEYRYQGPLDRFPRHVQTTRLPTRRIRSLA